MLQALKTAKKVVGIKQLKKALKEGIAQTVFLAQDADPQLTAPIAALCQANGVTCLPVKTMAELGQACGIDVGAAAAAIVK